MANRLETIVETLSPKRERGSLTDAPVAVQVMAWLFVKSRYAPFFKSVAMRALRVG